MPSFSFLFFQEAIGWVTLGESGVGCLEVHSRLGCWSAAGGVFVKAL